MKVVNKCICCGSKSLKKSPAVLMPFIANRVFDWRPIEITDGWNLRSIKKGMAYPLCNSLLCRYCGLLFCDVRLDDEEMKLLYEDYGGKRYSNLRKEFECDYKQRNGSLDSGDGYVEEIEQFLMPYIKLPASILDWGGLAGGNTPFRDNHKAFHIYDITNIPAIEGAKKIYKPSKKYDLIVCANVLEHVSYPIKVISDMKKNMKKNSILYIEIPHEDIMDTKQEKKYWHEHINFFTKKSLKILLANCNLEIINLKLMSASLSPTSSAFLYRIVCMKGGE